MDKCLISQEKDPNLSHKIREDIIREHPQLASVLECDGHRIVVILNLAMREYFLKINKDADFSQVVI